MKQESGRVCCMKKGVTLEMLANAALNDNNKMMASFLNEYENGILVRGNGNEVWEDKKNGQEN
jgi:Cu/Ag efflux pump CusA